MGNVTNWLLLLELEEEPAVAQVNQYLSKHAPHAEFCLLKDGWGGRKWPEVDVWGMATDGIEDDIVFAAIRAADWNEPEASMVAYCTAEDSWKCQPMEALLKSERETTNNPGSDQSDDAQSMP